jgi:hypothetical protein
MFSSFEGKNKTRFTEVKEGKMGNLNSSDDGECLDEFVGKPQFYSRHLVPLVLFGAPMFYLAMHAFLGFPLTGGSRAWVWYLVLASILLLGWAAFQFALVFQATKDAPGLPLTECEYSARPFFDQVVIRTPIIRYYMFHSIVPALVTPFLLFLAFQMSQGREPGVVWGAFLSLFVIYLTGYHSSVLIGQQPG